MRDDVEGRLLVGLGVGLAGNICCRAIDDGQREGS